MVLRWLFILLAFSGSWIKVHSQEPYTLTTFTTKEGLSHNRINDITQDKAGFLWIATWDGLCRFDGYEFKKYTHQPDDSTSPPHSIIMQVCCDRDDNLWILTDVNHSVARYNKEQDNFVTYRNNKVKENFILSSMIFSIALDDSLNLWAIGDKGIEKFNYNTKSIDHLSLPETICHKLTSKASLFYDNRYGTLWIWNIYILFQCRIRNIEGNKMVIPVKTFRIASNQVRGYSSTFKICSNKKGQHLFLSFLSNYFSDTDSDIFIPNNDSNILSNFPIREIFCNFSNDSILSVYHPITSNRFQIPMGKVGIPSFCFADHSGNIWFNAYIYTDEAAGLIKIRQIKSSFNNIHVPGNVRSGQSLISDIYGIAKDDKGNIWFCDRISGLSQYNYTTATIIRYPVLQNLGNQDSPVYPRVILDNGTDHLIVGYNIGYLIDFDTKKKTYSEYDSPFSICSLSEQDSYRAIARDKNGNIIAGKESGVYIYDLNRKRVLFSDSVHEVRSLFVDSRNNLWIGTMNSLISYTGKNYSKHIYYPYREGRYWIESICEENAENIWLASFGGGICNLNIHTGKFTYYNVSDGLSDNTTYSILKDRWNNLWISTNNGVSLLNLSTNVFRNFDESDGLNIKQFESCSGFQDTYGEIFFGGISGFVRFHPENLEYLKDEISSPLVITDFKIAGVSNHFNRPVYEMDTIRLEKGTNSFEISFACLDFNNADKIRYRYKLEGYNAGWVSSDIKNRFVNYMNIRPGTYLFSVEATDKSGAWNKSKTLVISIPFKVHQSLWFRIGIGALIAFLIAVIIIMRFRHMKLVDQKEMDLLNAKIKESKLDSLRSQMNPHFIFNSLNSINYFISISDKLRANQYVADFSRLMRAILNNTAHEYIELEKEIASLEDYCKLEHLRFGDKFDYSIEVDKRINILAYEIAPSMIQPFMENAIWHGVRYLEGRKGFVRITFMLPEDHFIICKVEDDGIGRKSSAERKTEEQKKRKSRGISIIEERLEIFNTMNKTKLEIQFRDLYPDKADTGTEVIIQIPVKLK
jgi:ligand-binding sensor domain-containing protein